MTNKEQDFRSFCNKVRFSLDEPQSNRTEIIPGAADFVARVRSSSLQVTSTTVPQIAGLVEDVLQSLRLDMHAEIYIVNDASSNAFVVNGAQANRPVIVISSGLVSLLDRNELAFTIGHELGHFGMGHGDAHAKYQSNNEIEALNRRSAQRYAEISADRIGLLVTKSTFIATRVMLKVASGLPAEMLGLDIDAFVRQAERDPAEFSRAWELGSSHPSLPLRLWALIRFAHSDLYLEISGQGRGGVPIAEVDAEIEKRMSLLGDSHLTNMEEQAYKTTLIWAAMALVLEDGRLDRQERDALIQLIGKEKAAKSVQYAQTNGRNAVFEKLSESIQRINGAGLATRRRFMEAFQSFSTSLQVSFDETHAGKIVQQELKLGPAQE